MGQNLTSCKILTGQVITKYRSFFHSLRAGVQPTLEPSAKTFSIGPMRQPRERRGVDRCVWCAR